MANIAVWARVRNIMMKQSYNLEYSILHLNFSMAFVNLFFSVFLPYRFGTWPHGQLFATARSGQYASNLTRYVNAFSGVGQVALGLPSVLTVIELDAELSRLAEVSYRFSWCQIIIQ